jgi:hypothetical protein
MLKELYVDTYGLAKLDDRHRPLALVAYHPKEDFGEGDRLFERIFQFKTYEIEKVYGCSLEEFVNYPRHVVEHLLKIQRDEFVKVQALKDKARRDAEREVSQQRNQHGMQVPPIIGPN